MLHSDANYRAIGKCDGGPGSNSPSSRGNYLTAAFHSSTTLLHTHSFGLCFRHYTAAYVLMCCLLQTDAGDWKMVDAVVPVNVRSFLEAPALGATYEFPSMFF
jgi:hypothetical protein